MYKYLLALVASVCLFGSSSVALAQHHGHAGHATHGHATHVGHSGHSHYANHAVWARYHHEVFVRAIVPSPYVEVVVPRSGYLWSTGYWSWTGARYVWTPGSWVLVVPGKFWVQPGWRYRGWTTVHGHRYLYVKGHWR